MDAQPRETPRERHKVRSRIGNACDLCKLRKIKCTGTTPCTYCVRKQNAQHCHYSPQKPRNGNRRPQQPSAGSDVNAPSSQSQLQSQPAHHPVLSHPPAPTPSPSAAAVSVPPTTGRPSSATTVNEFQSRFGRGSASHGFSFSRLLPSRNHQHINFYAPTEDHDHEDTEVPRDARLLCDPQGKLIFIGDCAPLSFFQTVRRLITSRIDPNAFAGHSALENAFPSSVRPSKGSMRLGAEPPGIKLEVIGPAVKAYLQVTAGLIDLFNDNTRLQGEVVAWANQGQSRDKTLDTTSAVNYLVLAIGCQALLDDHTAQLYFEYARDLAFADLSGNFGIGSLQGVQVHILITLYMLGAYQINGAFLFFGIAARAAYSIGIHRSAVNARFGPEIHRQRDRLWKSLRVVDLFLSTSMGRPPAASDIDCTVSYQELDESGREKFDLLNASAQILLITEAIVLEVYSRRKISPQLTEGISRELRDWSARWVHQLKDVVEGKNTKLLEAHPGAVNGACQVLSTYYYAVILVSRPFLMVELHHRLSDDHSPVGFGNGGLGSARSKLADACIDAGVLMLKPIHDLIAKGQISKRGPMTVAWLFASALVLGLGLLGGFGRVIEKHCRTSIAALEYFAESDSHAVQYSLIAKSLLATGLEHIEKRETEERLKRTESSSQLFGLIPFDSRDEASASAAPAIRNPEQPGGRENGQNKQDKPREEAMSPRFSFDFGSSFLGMTDPLPRTPEFSSLMGVSLDDADQTFGALNLFPLLESDSIDLAHLF